MLEAQPTPDTDDADGARTGHDATSAAAGTARRRPRARLLALLVPAAAALGLVGLGVSTHVPMPTDDPAAGLVYAGMTPDVVHCGTRSWRIAVPSGGPVGCGHLDAAPTGVDVRVRVSTTALQRRPGAGPAAAAAAQDAGVPSLTAASATTDPAVPCDGDGTSGDRVQAMYVVEAGATNRYADVQPLIQRWAAGVDDVFNRSAAVTGGVRHLRYVTQPDGSTCVAKVLDVTVPNGATVDFGHTIAAVQAQGYNAPGRKYLMWTDANRLCGIGLVYLDDRKGQENANNGVNPQYARIDNGCWGAGDGQFQHSVEAHELAHTLGSVMGGAPHATHAGHCWDESDTMCYSDGTTHKMVQVCPPSQEYLLDCNGDDYYSTYPDAGSWLDTHWDVANSQFLLGGGDGTGGGEAGTPIRLGAVIAVNNPAVAGLPTQAEVTPALPAGRTLTSVTWKAGSSSCVTTLPDDVDTTDPVAVATSTRTLVTCPASAKTATTVTATLVDSTGAKKVVASPLTFAATGTRAVAVAAHVAGQGGTAESVCPGAATPWLADVTDVATGEPVLGLRATLTKQAVGGKPSTTTATTLVNGTARGSLTTTAPVTTTVTTAALGRFAAGAADAGSVTSLTATRCAPVLSAGADADETFYGDAVVVHGTLTRPAGADQVSVPGASLAVQEVVAGGRVLALGTAKSGDDGAYALTVHPTTSGMLRVSLASAAPWTPAVAVAGDLAVALPTTALTGTAADLDVGYGAALTADGALARVADADTRPVAGGTVTLRVRPEAGAPVVLGSARTSATGGWHAVVAPKASGELQAVFAGAAGLPAATLDLGTLHVGTWQPALTLAVPAGTRLAGTAVPVTGTVTRTYDGATTPATGVKVQLVLHTTTGADVVLASTTSTSTGTFKATPSPAEQGTLTARVAGVAGYADAASDGADLSVLTRLTTSAAKSVTAGVAVPVTVVVAVPRALAVTLQVQDADGWTTAATGTTSDAGRLTLSVPAWGTGVRAFRAVTDGDGRAGAGTSATVTVTAH